MSSDAKKLKRKNWRRRRAHLRVRNSIDGTAERPRLTVYKSLRYVYAQLVDDREGATLAAASSLEEDLREGLEASPSSVEAARAVGTEIARRALDKDIDKVVFDRSGYRYHGKVKAVAEAAREAGLQF